ncbi:MAG: magnesium transporter CorA family protein [Clostridiaceae bacterium]|nr:magnesium transporter CorA family protein [Clostridiaceae bacterium]
MGTAQIFRVSQARKLIAAGSVDEVMSQLQPGEFFWLHYVEPTAKDLDPLIRQLGLHPLSVEDALDKNSIPKIDIYPDTTLVLINAFTYQEKKLHVQEIDMILGEHFLVSVDRLGPDGKPLLDGITATEGDAWTDKHVGPAYIMHALLDTIVDRKLLAIEAIEEELAQAEDALFERPADFDPKSMQHIRRSLLQMRKSLYHEREVFMKISRRDCPLIPEKAVFHYRDIYDHITRCFELAESLRDMETSLMEIDLSLRSNEMALAASRTNRSLGRLTFISTIFLPLTLLASIGGMSEWSMMTGPENWRITYPLFLLAMAVIGTISYWLLRWLARRDATRDDKD